MNQIKIISKKISNHYHRQSEGTKAYKDAIKIARKECDQNTLAILIKLLSWEEDRIKILV